jgi:hypothetical protein
MRTDSVFCRHDTAEGDGSVIEGIVQFSIIERKILWTSAITVCLLSICSIRNCYSGIVNRKTFCKIPCSVDGPIATYNNVNLHYALNRN